MDFAHSGKLKAVTFSYDDGVTQDIRLIELLNQYGLKATFNLNSQALGSRGMLTCLDRRVCHYKIHPEDVKTIYDGHEVAGHTLTHPNLTQLDDNEIIRQVEEDRQNLSAFAGYEVVGMAYPCGGVNNNDHVAKVIKEHTGMRYCRTITSTDNFDKQENLYRFNPSAYHLNFDNLMTMGQQFLELNPTTPKIFYIWGHSYELDCGMDYWSRLEEFFKLIGGHQDIYYGTNKEVLL